MGKRYCVKDGMRNAWLKRALQLWLAGGLLALPWAGLASDIVRTDGATGDKHNGTIHDIYAGKALQNNTVGVSTFSKFDVTTGDVANMHFRTAGGSQNFNTLLNFVDNKININGTVNAIRNGGIGGHLFFLSPQGMVVGREGAINAGSLTVLTPTNTWWKENKSLDLSEDTFKSITQLGVPINASGTIAVQGKVSVTDNMYFKAGRINIGMNDAGGDYSQATLQSGQVDFSQLVNMTYSQKQASGLTATSATRAEGSGDIILSAEVSYNENTDTIKDDKVSAEVKIAGGSQITAVNNLDVTATATNNVTIEEYVRTVNNPSGEGTIDETYYKIGDKEVSASDFKSKYTKSGSTGTVLFGSNITTSAKVTISNEGAAAGVQTTLQGDNVNISALAKNIYTSSSTGTFSLNNVLDKTMTVLLNGLDVSYGILNSEAIVDLEANTLVNATGQSREWESWQAGVASKTIKHALNIQAQSDIQLEVGSSAKSLNVLATTEKLGSNTNFIPSLQFAYGKAINKAEVKVAGTLQSNSTTNIAALANNTLKVTAATGLFGMAMTPEAAFNIGITGLEGSNTALVGIASTAVVDKGLQGDINVTAKALNNITNSNTEATGNEAATAFAISWTDYGSQADIKVDADLTSTGGGISLFADSEYPINSFTAAVTIGYGFLANVVRGTAFANTAAKTLGDKLGKIIWDCSPTNAIFGGSLAKLSNYGLGDAGSDGKSAFDIFKDYLKLGITFGYLKEQNDANITIGNVKVQAAGALNLEAKAYYDDVAGVVTGSSKNASTNEESKGSSVLANGAVFIKDVNNNANVTVATGTAAKHGVLQGASVDVQATAQVPYNRINNMIKTLQTYADNVSNLFNDEDYKDFFEKSDAGKLLKERQEKWQAKLAEAKEKLLDEKEELRSTYGQDAEGYKKAVEDIQAICESEEYKAYDEALQAFLNDKKYTYTDDNNVQHTIEVKDSELGFFKKIGSFFSNAMGVVTSAVSFVNPASYLTYNVYSITSGKANTADNPQGSSKYAAAIGFGTDYTENNARILIGKHAVVKSTNGDVIMNASTKYGGVALDGSYFPTGGGSNVSGGAIVGVHHVDNNGMIVLAEDSQVNSAKDITLDASNSVVHVGLCLELGMGSGDDYSINVAYVGTDSNNIVSVDDEAKLEAAKKLTLTGDNFTTVVGVNGAMAMGSAKAGGVGVSILNINRNNLVTVMDNDGAGDLAEENKKNGNTKATDLVKEDDLDSEDSSKSIYRDDEKKRLQKLLATKSGLSQDDTISFYKSTDSTAGSIKVGDLEVKATTAGYIVNLVVDAGLSMSGDATEPGVGDKIGTWVSNLTNKISNKVGALDNAFTKKIFGTSTWQEKPTDQEPTNASAGQDMPKLSLAGAGSVGVSDVDALTGAVLDGANITITTQGTNKSVNVHSEDKGSIVTIAGGFVLSMKTNKEEKNKGHNSAISLVGAGAVNLVNNDLSSLICKSNIQDASIIKNSAVRAGALAAVGAALGISTAEGVSANYSLSLGASVDVAKNTTKATLQDNTVDNYQGTTTLQNVTSDKDVQVTGGIEVSAISSDGKKNLGIGAVVSWGYIDNVVKSQIDGGNYISLGNVVNDATTDLTQVSAAVGFGISKNSSQGSSYSFQGAGAITDLHNDVEAAVTNVEKLEAESLNLTAYDYRYEGEANEGYVKTLKDKYGLDTSGSSYTSEATSASEKGADLQDNGNIIVTGAVQIALATGLGGGAAGGVAAAVNVVDNDFRSTIDNSTITLTNDKDAAKIFAESNTLVVGIAAGANSSSMGLGCGGSVVVDYFKNDVLSTVKKSNINTSSLEILANKKEKIVNVAGEYAGGKNAIGLTMVYNYMITGTGAYLEDSVVYYDKNKDDKEYDEASLKVEAINDSKIYAIAIGVVSSDNTNGKIAANGAVGVNRGQNNVEAVVRSTDSAKHDLINLKDLTIHSKDDSYMAAAAGGLTLSTGKVALGGALTWNRLGNLVINEGDGTISSDNGRQTNRALLSGYDVHMADAGSLTIKAEEIAGLTTASVGCALSSGYWTVQGTNANVKLETSTSATIEGGSINNSDTYGDKTKYADVNVTANTQNTLNTISGVVAFSKDGVALGAAASQNTLNADTSAQVAAGSKDSTYRTKNLLVQAESTMKMLDVTVGVAASGTVSVGGSVVDSVIGNNTYATLGSTNGGLTTVEAQGNVGVISLSKEDFDNYSGQANITIGGVAGGGLAIALNEVKGDTLSTVQNAAVTTDAAYGKAISLRDSIADKTLSLTGLVVGADAFHDFYNAPFCGGLTVNGGELAIGADATISVDNIHGNTRAKVVATEVNKSAQGSTENNNFTVQATDKTTSEAVVTNAVLSIAANVGVAVAVGASVNTEKNHRTVEALVEGSNGRKNINADKVSVKADSYAKLKAINTAVSVAGSGAASGALTAGVIYGDQNITTRAAMTGITSYNNGLDILANHKDDMTLIGTGVTLAVSPDFFSAGAAVGVAVSSENNTATTQAELKGSNIYHYQDGTAQDSIKATSDSVTLTQTANVTAAISLLSVSLGVLVADNDLKETVKASVTDSTIGTAEKQAEKITVHSDNKVTGKFYNQNVSVGMAGLGVGVGLNTVDTSVSANVANATFYAKEDIDIKATETITLNGVMVAVSGGALSVGVSTLHNYVGTAVVEEDYSNWDETHKDEKDSSKTKVSSSQVQQGEYSAKKIDGLSVKGVTEANESITNIKTAKKATAQTPVTKVARSATLTNEGDQVNLANANLYAGGNIAIQAQEEVNTDTDLGGGSVGLVSIQVEVNRQRITGKVGSNITGGMMQAGGNITVDSLMQGTLKNRTVQVGIGGAAVGVTIGELTKQEGGTSITLNTAEMNADGSISLISKDSLAMENKGVSASAGIVVATAVDFYARDNATSTITLAYDKDYNNGQGKGNSLQASTITIGSYSVPNIASNFTAVAVSLVSGSGVVMESKANNKAVVNLQGKEKLWGDNITIESEISSISDKDNVSTDVVGVSASAASVVVNKAKAYTDVQVTTEVGELTLKTEEEKDSNSKKKVGKSNVTIAAKNSISSYSSVVGVTVGLIAASGSNYAITDNKSTVTTTVAAGSEGLYAQKLDILAENTDSVVGDANGAGGGIIGINPNAATIDAKVTGNTTTNLRGTFNVASTLNAKATRTDDLRYTADAAQAQVVGASDVNWKLVGNEKTNLNLNNAAINSANANFNSTTTANLNQPATTEASSLDKAEAPYVAVRSSGAAGAAFDASYLDNTWNIDSKVNVAGGKITVTGPLNLEAYTLSKMAAYNYVQVIGLLGGSSEGVSKNNLTITDEVNLQDGGELRTTGVGSDVTLSAADDLNVKVGAETTVTGISLIGTVTPDVDNTIKRNNKIDVKDGQVFSTHDVNLYAGKKVNGTVSLMDLGLYSLSHNKAAIPAGFKPELSNNVTANNVVLVEKAGEVLSTRHVNFYADAGNEILTKTLKGFGASETTSVVSVKGGTTTGTNTKDSFVQVDGSVVAGVANKLDITIGSSEKCWGFVQENDGKSVSAAYAGDEEKLALIFDATAIADYVSFGDEASQQAAEVAKISADDFHVQSESYNNSLATRLSELEDSITAYRGDEKVYNNLLVEINRIKALLNNNGGSQSHDQYDSIIVPDLIASGGNINLDTLNFKGTGTVKAQGNPSITVTNNTNLTMKLNRVNVDDPGGIIYYNTKALDGDDLKAQVQQANTDKTLTIPTLSAAKGTTASIKIIGNYNGNSISYENRVYQLDSSGEYITELEKVDAQVRSQAIQDEKGDYYIVDGTASYKPRADVVLNGNVDSLNGSVAIISKNDDILIQGKTVSDSVNINGKVISIQALKGSVTQAYSNAICNIGGDVKSLYNDSYTQFVNNNDGKEESSAGSTGLIITTLEDGQKAPEIVDSSGQVTGNYIVGDQVFINAADININGVIQSGFGDYYVKVDTEDATVQENINKITANWRSSETSLSDDAVLGNDNYRVVEGGAYWSSADGCYKYQLNVYYNPSTKRLLTENVESNGGRIYLAGRIASTGNGNIICLDGAYNINVENQLTYDLQVGNLVVNEVEGKISLVDTDAGIITDITRNSTTTRYLNDEKEKARTTDLTNTHVTKNSDGTYTYTPTAGLAYNWITGYRSGKITKYEKKNRKKGFIFFPGEYKTWTTDTLSTLVQGAEKLDEITLGDKSVKAGAVFVTTGNGSQSGANYSHSYSISKSVVEKDGETRYEKNGWWIFSTKKYEIIPFKVTDTRDFTDYASVKADNPINIKFIGSTADSSQVQVTTTQDLYLTGNVGNKQLYQNNDDYAEKGTINLSSKYGSIIQKSNNIYGSTVNLSAAANLLNIQISAGNTVNLTGSFNGTGDITVNATYGGGVGNVLLNNLGSTQATALYLTAAGNIIQNTGDNLVQAKQINLVSGGLVSGQNGGVFYLQGGQATDVASTDGSDANVNIQAKGDIVIAQKTGDLRAGKIYSTEGNLTVYVENGAIVDALPSEENTTASQEKLLEEWENAGVVQGDGEGWQKIQEVQKAAKEAASKYKERIETEYAAYEVLTKKQNEYQQQTGAYQTALTEATSEYAEYQELIKLTNPTVEQQTKMGDLARKFMGYKSAQEYVQGTFFTQSEQNELAVYSDKYSQVTSAADYLDKSAEYQELKKSSDSVAEYTGWDKNALLYAVEDSIIHPDTAKDLTEKSANLFAKNIRLYVRDGVGLNGEQSTIAFSDIGLEGEKLNNLKKLATADVATVKIDNDNQQFIITPQVSLGLQQGETGIIAIYQLGKDADQKSNIYVEGRKLEEKVLPLKNQYLDFRLNTVYSEQGNVRIANSGSIYNVGDGVSLITGSDLYLHAGNGSLGTQDTPITFDITGNLTALALNNVYLAVKDEDAVSISNILAGKLDGAYSADSGNIYLTVNGDMLMSEDSLLNQSYICSYTDGTITLTSTKGNLGTDGRGIAIVNSVEEEARKNRGQVLLSAAKGIYVEGVSSATGGKDATEGVAPEGILNVVQASTGNHSLSFTVNGTLQMPGVSFYDENENLDGVLVFKAVNINLSEDMTAATMNFTGAYGFKQEAGTLRAKDLRITTGEKFEINSGKIIWDEKELQEAPVTQVNGSSGVIAGILAVCARGDINLDSEKNQISKIVLDAGEDVSLALTSLTDSLFAGMNANDVVNLSITNTHDNNEHTYEFQDSTETRTNVTGGRVEVYIYKNSQGNAPDLQISGDLLAAGDLVLYNESGKVELPKDQDIYADGAVLIYSGGQIISDVNYKSTGGIALVAKESIDINAKYVEGKSLYLRSLENDILDSCEPNSLVAQIGGDLTLIADEGDVVLNRSYLVDGDITIRAKESIESSNSQGLVSKNGDITIYTTGTKSDEQKSEGWLLNDAPLTAKNGDVYIYAYNGVLNSCTMEAKDTVTIFSNGAVINGDGVPNDDYIHGENGVAIVAQGYLNNMEALWADNGNVTLGGIYDDATAGSTWAAFQGSVTNSGFLYSGTKGDISIVATGTLANSGSIYTNQGAVAIASQDNLTNTEGIIYTNSGDVSLSSEKALTNTTGIYTLVGNVAVTSGENLTNSGDIYTNSGSVELISGGDLQNTASTLYAKGGGVSIAAEKGEIDNHSPITADANIIISGKDVISEGTLSAGKAVTITSASTLQNTGKIEAKGGDLQIDGGSVAQSGALSATGDVGVTGSVVALTGDITAQKVTLQAKGGTLTMDGVVTADGNVNFDAKGKLTNMQKITSAKGSIEMNSDAGLENKGALQAAEGISIAAQESLANFGAMETQAGVTFSVWGGALTNEGSIQAAKDVDLYGDAGITNGGEITSDTGDIDLISSGYMTNQKNLQAAKQVILLAGENLINQGAIQTRDGATLLSLAGTLNNEGSVQTTENIYLYGAAGVTNTGSITSDEGEIDLLSGNYLQNSAALFAGEAVTLASEKDLTNTAGIHASGGNVAITSGGNLRTSGDIYGYSGPVELTSGGDMINAGNIYANNGSVKLTSGGDLKHTASTIYAQGGSVSLVAENGGIDSHSSITADTDVIIDAKAVISEGAISAGNSVAIISASTLQTIGDIMAKDGDVELLGKVGVAGEGDMFIQGGLSGRKIAIATENSDAKIYLNLQELKVSKELLLAGNKWNDGVAIDMSMLNQGVADGQDCLIRILSAGYTTQGATYNLDFGQDGKAVVIEEVGVDKITLNASGPVKINNLQVADIGAITTMGTKTDVYGKLQGYDGDAKVIYYAPGVSYLDIQSALVQRGNGILLRNYPGQHTYTQRFSLEQILQREQSFAAPQLFNGYFHIGGIDFYLTHNVVEIPEVTVNSGEKAKKELEWEF